MLDELHMISDAGTTGAACANAHCIYSTILRVQKVGALGAFVQQINPKRQITNRTMRIEDINNF